MADETIAHYRIGAKLGEGGMGEVYQATDTKLHREVALKLLPEAFTEDAETLERFRREARALAALSHPNIGAIHGIEESDGRVALVLELIEGDTLADRIAEGRLGRDEVFRIAEQVAAALEAAHDQGIVHRDLKPANIKITPEGQAKVLDFGLAKSIEHSSRGGVAESPTIMMTAAQPGMVMGTAPYMSPEQAKGAPVDRRADIWAYGAVLFEMFTERRLFEGDDVTEVLAAVISTEPDLSGLPDDLPAWLRDLITRCLRRDLTMRLPHMAAARIALQEADDNVDEAVVDAAAPASGLGWMPVLVAIVLAAALGAYTNSFLAPGGTDTAAPTQYTELNLDPPPMPDSFPAISPDGRLIAYSGASETQRQMLFIRNLADGSTRPIPGSEYGEVPAFSPDGGSVAFIAAGILRVAALGGGFPESIATIAGGPEGVVWADQNTIVFATQGARYLQRIASTGGAPELIAVQHEGAEELWVTDPAPLPDPGTLLVSIEGPDTDGPRVAALTLRDGMLTEIARGSGARFVAPSTLVFLQRDDLVAARFDPSTLALTGAPRSLPPAGTVMITNEQSAGERPVGAIASRGLALFPMEIPELRELVWLDRGGEETPTGFGWGDGAADNLSFTGSAGLSLSPDGKQVALVGGAPFIVDLDDVSQRRVLPRPGSSVSYPRWDPSGENISVIGNEDGTFQGYRIPAQVGAQPQQFTDVPGSIPTSFFPDGKSVIGYIVAAETARDLWVFHLDGQADLLLQTPANERGPMLSPDGTAYAYVSDESGEDRIYLRLYPDVGQAWELSGDGASEPIWSRDGSEVFFIEDARMMAVSVDTTDGVRHGTPQELFSVDGYESDPFGNTMYDVAADGRFLTMRLGKGPREWRLIQNWGTDLRAIVEEP